MYFDKTIFEEDGLPIEVDVICDKCGKILKITNLNVFSKISSDYCIIAQGNGIECECGNHHKKEVIEYKKLYSLDELIVPNKNINQANIPKCPTCGSTNVEKISTGKKVLGGAMFGLFSSDIRNTMHCKNCGAKW